MPSFEHTDSRKQENNADSLYKPGSDTENSDVEDAKNASTMPVSKPQVTYTGDVEAEERVRAMEAEEAAQKAEAEAQARAGREGAEAERSQRHTPRFIDAELPDPGPSIMQGISRESNSSEDKPRRSGLSGRNRGGAKASASGPSEVESFGEVKAGEAQEALSGKRVKDGKLEAPTEKPRRERKPRKTGDGDTTEATESAGNREKSHQRKPRERKPREDRQARSRDRKTGDNERGGRAQKAAAPSGQGNPPRKPATQKASEPESLLGKVQKVFKNLFGSNEPQKMTDAAKEPEAKKQPARKRARRGKGGQGRNAQGQKGQGPKQGQRAGNQQQGDGGPKRRRNRRGGRGRGGNNNRGGQPRQDSPQG